MSTTSPGGPVRWLNPDEERAWRAFLRAMVAVQTGTARDLAAIGLSEADYEVLSTLSERPDHTSTLGEQADKMGWSRSRLSRHASRMEARGLLRRAPDPNDGRGCLLALTPKAWTRSRPPHRPTSNRCDATSSTGSPRKTSPPSSRSPAS